MQTTIQVRGVNTETKKQAEQVFAQMGITASAAVKLFLNQVAKTGSIPFEPTTLDINGFNSLQQAQIQKAIEEPHSDEFPSMHALIEDLKKH